MVRDARNASDRDGATHVIFAPLYFNAFSHEDFVFMLTGETRLAALVPKPRVNLTRFRGVFAPNSTHRARATSAKRGRVSRPH